MRVLRLLGVAALAVPALATPAAHPVAAQSPAGEVSLALQTSWVGPGGAFELRLDVNDLRAPEQVEVAVSVHRRLTSRSAYARSVAGEGLGTPLRSFTSPLLDLGFDAAGTVPVTLAADQLPRSVSAPEGGVFPVSVELREAGGGGVIDGFTTHLVRVPEATEAPPLQVAWVQPVVAPPTLRPDGTTRSPVGLDPVVRALAASDTTLTLVPTPEALGGLAARGLDLSAAVEGRQVVGGPFVDVDLDQLLAAGLDDELAPLRQRGDDAIVAALGTAPISPVAVADGPLGARALSALADLGAERVVLPEAALQPLLLDRTLTRTFLVEDREGRQLAAAAADPALAAHLEGSDPVLAAHHLLADLAVLYFDAPGRQVRGVVVQPAPGLVPAAELLSTALPALGDSPILAPVTLDGLFDAVPADAEPALVRTLAPAPTPAALGLDGGDLAGARAAVAGWTALVGEDLAAPDDLDDLLLVALASGLRPDERSVYVDQVLATADGADGSVSVLDRGGFRLSAREGTIPLTLANANPYPVRVRIVLASEKLEFLDADGRSRLELEQVLAADTTSLPVRVRARTGGSFPLSIRVTSPDLTRSVELVDARFTVRSSPSGVGVVLSIGAGAFLLLWWALHFRTVRRSRRLAPAAT